MIQAQPEKLNFRWKIITNNYCDQELTLSEFTIRNNGSQSIKPGTWALYFSFTRRILVDSAQSGIKITSMGGDFYKVEPIQGFTPVLPGKTLNIRLISQHWAFMLSDFPRGAYWQENGKLTEKDIQYDFPAAPHQILANKQDKRLAESSLDRYKANERLSLIPGDQLPPFLPSPLKYQYLPGFFQLKTTLQVSASGGLGSEHNYLVQLLKQLGLKAITSTQLIGRKHSIRLLIDKEIKNHSYFLSVSSEEGITIKAANAESIFSGIQSLRSLILKNPGQLPCLEITDTPRFEYRGVLLDVARNFQTKETVKQLLDKMALYKFNKLHFHLTDDEGWRLEINGLPELTAYGAFRGHTEDESSFLQPAYGSGPLAVMGKSSGSGFYNRSSFIEILKYAAERHIEIIPEIDLPGHARAAIKAMDYRYRKYMALGKTAEATEYLLRDTNDLSVYTSIQGYKDNVVCICQPSLYHFLGKVVMEMENMYRDAGISLKTVHIGGDEVPAGAWEQSPVCRKFLASHPEYPDVRSLEEYFISKFNEILILRNITTAGWEEVGLQRDLKSPGHPVTARKEFQERGLQMYSWNSIWGDGTEDNSSILANAGFKVVQANATNLYLDMAYAKDPYEQGYYWANYVNTETAFQFTPTQIPYCARTNKSGDTIRLETFLETFIQLTDKGKSNLLGIEACLWGENINSPELIDYMLFPRLIAIAERAWARKPVWETEPDAQLRSDAYLKDYNKFANMMGQKELPMLEKMGIKYRIPLPGIKLENQVIKANVEFPGLPIRVGNTNSPIGKGSTIYKEAIPFKKGMKLATVLSSGRKSRLAEP
ncbi:MAG: carbohydate-binding domain-containing protein [Bacteroidales bacterium]|nr:carbohydate-binding domain-containing protein [Bacteroidales bacterium]